MGKLLLHRNEIQPGDRLSDVFDIWARDESGALSGTRVCDGSPALIVGADACAGRITVYDGQVGGHEHCLVLFVDDQSAVIQIPKDDECPLSCFIEIFGGFGGMGLAAKFLGGETKVAIDWNSLSARQLRQHGVEHVLEADVSLKGTIKEAHMYTFERKMVALMGFPCQPHSLQGRRDGFHDPRAGTLYDGLRAIFLLQCDAAVLECVSQAGQNTEVISAVRELADLMGWTMQCVD